MGRNEMVERARSAFKEVLDAMEEPNPQLLQRDPVIKGLIETIVRHVEDARKPENWPVEDYPDNYRAIHPSDSWQWGWLLTISATKNQELASILCYLRGTGCILVKDNMYGYVIRPVIGKNGWSSAMEYDKEKKPLQDHIELLMTLLKKMAELERQGKLIPAREYVQGRF